MLHLIFEGIENCLKLDPKTELKLEYFNSLIYFSFSPKIKLAGQETRNKSISWDGQKFSRLLVIAFKEAMPLFAYFEKFIVNFSSSSGINGS